jgi:crotonobetainyl-CoA:carnitine CoA-transferase CaiB-like acyl-CoA transferase
VRLCIFYYDSAKDLFSIGGTMIRDDLPLEQFKVIELASRKSGKLAGHLLAEQGALVKRLLDNSDVTLESSYLNRGKQLVTKINLFAELSKANVLIADHRPQLISQFETSPEALRKAFPSLIIVTCPSFLANDPHEENVSEEIVASATGLYTDIHPARSIFGLDPVYTAIPLSSIYAGVHAATSVVLALKGKTGVHIEASLAGASMTAMSTQWMQIPKQPSRYDVPRLPFLVKRVVLPILRSFIKPDKAKSQSNALSRIRSMYPALMRDYKCADGHLLYIFAIDNPRMVKRLLNCLGLMEKALAAGLVFRDPFKFDLDNNLAETSNLSKYWQKTLNGWITIKMKSRTSVEWEKLLSAEKVACSVHSTVANWMSRPELKAAGLSVEMETPSGDTIYAPGPKVWLGARKTNGPDYKVNLAKNIGNGSPLSGLKVIDICSMVAGPIAGRALSEYGADVIKIEHPTPGPGPRLTHWYGLDVNAGKRSVILDLKDRDDQKALHTLLHDADVLITNHLPEAMKRMALGTDKLAEVAPNITVCRISAFGGPIQSSLDNRPGYDPVLQAASGISTRYGSSDNPEVHALASCVDALTGYLAAFGIITALHANRPQNVGTSLAVAATLTQLPFAFSAEQPIGSSACGQQAKGSNSDSSLYRCKNAWLFADRKPLSSNTSVISKDILQSLPLDKAIRYLLENGFSVQELKTIEQLRAEFVNAREDSAMRLIHRQHHSLGPIIQVPPAQCCWNGSALPLLTLAEEPGASTNDVLIEIGLPKHFHNLSIGNHALPH